MPFLPVPRATAAALAAALLCAGLAVPGARADGAAKPATERASEQKKAPLIPVRVGEHPGYSRFVFDWTGPVDYALGREGDRAILRFEKPGRFDVDALRRDLPPFVAAVDAGDLLTGPGFALTVADGARLRHFRHGMSIVVDVLAPVANAAPPKTKPRANPGPPAEIAALVPPGTKPEPGRKTDKPAPVADKAKAAKPSPSASADPVPLAAQAARSPQTAEGTAPDSPAAHPPAQAQPAEAAVSAAPPDGAGAGTPRVALIADRVVADARHHVPEVPVTAALGEGEATIRFNWSSAVAAAVFTRAGHLWAVFDHDAALTFEDWPDPGPRRKRLPLDEVDPRTFLAKPQFNTLSGNAIFRMPLPDGVNPRVTRDRNAWVVVLERDYLRPATGLAVESHLGTSSGARVFIPMGGVSDAVTLRDPEVGDRIWVVPLAAAGRGVGLGRTFAEAELFPTAQGLAGRALADDVVFRTLPRGVEIAAEKGSLALSGAGLQAARAESRDRAAPGPLGAGVTRPGWLLDFESWSRAGEDGFVPVKHRLMRAAFEAGPVTRNAARFALAQFYFAHDHLADVKGLLQVIEQDEPELAREPAFLGLRGATYYQLGDLDRAGRDLSSQSLDPFKEISLWRAGLAARQGEWETAARYFARSETVMNAYPERLRVRFGLLAAETALEIGDYGLAKFHLDTLAAAGPDRRIRARADYLRGRLLVAVRDPVAAADAFVRAMNGPDRPTRVRAQLARIDLLRRTEKLTPAQAIGEMEKLRFAWRGDGLEFRVLHRLGAAYIAAGDYRNGLMTLRELATGFRDHADAGKVLDEMRAAFLTLYVDGAADRLPPLTALALYDEFRDLTPQGAVGNDLIAKLADRLVAVDLLDRAAGLLRHLVDKRLTGLDRFEAANRLALVLLLDRRPADALAALAGQVPEDLAPDIVTVRQRLKARALGELTRYAEALALIANDSGREAEILRAGIFWRMRDWPKAAISYGAMVAQDTRGDGKATVKVDLATQRDILNLGIALALAQDTKGLDALRARFARAMEKSAYADAFALVTGHGRVELEDYKVIAARVAEVDQFQAFMESYRARLLPNAQPQGADAHALEDAAGPAPASPPPAAQPAQPGPQAAAATPPANG